MRAASPLLQTLLRCETVIAHRQPVARTMAALQPIVADSRRPGRAKILPKAGRAPCCLPTKLEYSPAASQRFALRQVSRRPRVARFPADCYLTRPAIARALLPAPLQRLTRWLRGVGWKASHDRIVREDSAGTSILGFSW